MNLYPCFLNNDNKEHSRPACSNFTQHMPQRNLPKNFLFEKNQTTQEENFSDLISQATVNAVMMSMNKMYLFYIISMY